MSEHSLGLDLGPIWEAKIGPKAMWSESGAGLERHWISDFDVYAFGALEKSYISGTCTPRAPISGASNLQFYI